MAMPDPVLRTNYQTGLQQFAAGFPLGGTSDPAFFIIPASVAAVRKPRGFFARRPSPPHFDQLTQEEVFAAHAMRNVILGIGDPIGDFPGLFGEISVLQCQLFALKSEPIIGQKQLDRFIRPACSMIREVQASGLSLTSGDKVSTWMGDFDWLERNPDPDLWHIIVAEANYDNECSEDFVSWVIEQPLCDRATAAYLFLGLDGIKYVCDRAPNAPVGAEFGFKTVRRICERSENGDGFPRSELTLSEHGRVDDQRPTLDRMLRAAGSGPSAPIPVPKRLLARPFEGRPARTPFVFHSETLIESRW